MLSKRGALILVALIGIFILLGLLRTRKGSSPAARFASDKTALREGHLKIGLAEAKNGGVARVLASSDGHHLLRVQATNQGEEFLEIDVPAGLVFSHANGASVVTIRAEKCGIRPGQTVEVRPMCVAVHMVEPFGEAPFELSSTVISQLAVLLPYLEKRTDVPQPAIQIAVLAVTDNIPLSAVSQFPLAAGASPVGINTDRYRVSTRYLIQGLQLLQEIGYPLERLALMADPQLKIEAMVDPLSHAEARKFYKIPEGKEWSFWRDHLLNGPLDTRHYALFGIARYFPGVALQMLPEWALKHPLDPVYRESAIRALAQTASRDALPVLERVRYDLEREPALEQVARETIRVLQDTLDNPRRFAKPVPFRITNPEIIPLPDVPEELPDDTIPEAPAADSPEPSPAGSHGGEGS